MLGEPGSPKSPGGELNGRVVVVDRGGVRKSCLPGRLEKSTRFSGVPDVAALWAQCPASCVHALLERNEHSIAVLDLTPMGLATSWGHGAAFEPDLLIKSADPIHRPRHSAQ